MMSKTYPIERSKLYRLRNRRKLAEMLGLSHNFFKNENKFKYNEFPILKANGRDYRLIQNPEPELKVIHSRLRNLLSRIETPEWVYSKKKKSYIDNAGFHQGNRYVKTMDITRFYESIKSNYIYKMFIDEFQMEPDIARLLTNLVSYNGKLPTGSPSSPIIAFWANKKMFEEIKEISDKYGCLFSLYVDDMVFSSNNPIPGKMREEIEEVLEKNQLKSKKEKDHYYQNKKFRKITGVGIKNGKMVVLNKHRKKIIDLYQKCRNENGEQLAKDIRKLKGCLYTARLIQPRIFPQIVSYVNNYEKGC